LNHEQFSLEILLFSGMWHHIVWYIVALMHTVDRSLNLLRGRLLAFVTCRSISVVLSIHSSSHPHTRILLSTHSSTYHSIGLSTYGSIYGHGEVTEGYDFQTCKHWLRQHSNSCFRVPRDSWPCFSVSRQLCVL
jgi:hypothetical protein